MTSRHHRFGRWLLVALVAMFVLSVVLPVEVLRTRGFVVASTRGCVLILSRDSDIFVSRLWLPYPLLVGLVVVLPYVWELRSRRRARGGLCVNCGYDLRASLNRCPECGTTIDASVNARLQQNAIERLRAAARHPSLWVALTSSVPLALLATVWTRSFFVADVFWCEQYVNPAGFPASVRQTFRSTHGGVTFDQDVKVPGASPREISYYGVVAAANRPKEWRHYTTRADSWGGSGPKGLLEHLGFMYRRTDQSDQGRLPVPILTLRAPYWAIGLPLMILPIMMLRKLLRRLRDASEGAPTDARSRPVVR